jgi:signal transduction histidine kinase
MLRNARTRLVFAGALLNCLAMIVVLGLVYWTANRIIENETRNVVHAELSGLADSYGTLGIVGLARAIKRRIESSEEPDAVYLLTNMKGVLIEGNLGAWPPTVKPGGGWVEIELIRTDSDRSVPIAAASVQLRGGERLLVGRDASARRSFTSALARSSVWALLAAAGLSLITGLLLTRLVFTRIAEISDTADDIVSGDLTRRIPIRGTGDEFDRVGATLNDMLDRIEDLVANLRTTTDSLAHDLRSPLTRLRTHIEMLTKPDLPTEERDLVAVRSVAEIDRLLRVFSDLTEIARAEARLGRSEFEPVDLALLAADVAEFYSPVGAERGVSITLEGAVVPVPAHKALLSQAMSNLLENALRYAPNNSVICIRLDDLGQTVSLSVSDSGPGIPKGDRQGVVRPFVTLDPSRTGGASGLGLALVASVARLHDGEIMLADNAPGLVVTITVATRML